MSQEKRLQNCIMIILKLCLKLSTKQMYGEGIKIQMQMQIQMQLLTKYFND